MSMIAPSHKARTYRRSRSRQRSAGWQQAVSRRHRAGEFLQLGHNRPPTLAQSSDGCRPRRMVNRDFSLTRLDRSAWISINPDLAPSSDAHAWSMQNRDFLKLSFVLGKSCSDGAFPQGSKTAAVPSPLWVQTIRPAIERTPDRSRQKPDECRTSAGQAPDKRRTKPESRKSSRVI